MTMIAQHPVAAGFLGVALVLAFIVAVALVAMVRLDAQKRGRGE